jgi:hypothetical protein
MQILFAYDIIEHKHVSGKRKNCDKDSFYREGIGIESKNSLDEYRVDDGKSKKGNNDAPQNGGVDEAMQYFPVEHGD